MEQDKEFLKEAQTFLESMNIPSDATWGMFDIDKMLVEFAQQSNASQFPDSERVIEILQKYERKIDDSDYHDTAVFNCDYKSIADELRSLPNHSEDNLDMVSLPEGEKADSPMSDDNKLKISDEIEVETSLGEIRKVKVIDITPHPEVPGSVYYEFDDGSVCRDIRLHKIPSSPVESKEEQAKKEYPEEFTIFCINSVTRMADFYLVDMWKKTFKSIPELYQYWLNNIAKKGGKDDSNNKL